MDSNSDPATIGASISPELKRKIRVEAARRDCAMADIIREAVEEWCEREAPEELTN
jgi:hypothetical protein